MAGLAERHVAELKQKQILATDLVENSCELNSLGISQLFTSQLIGRLTVSGTEHGRLCLPDSTLII